MGFFELIIIALAIFGGIGFPIGMIPGEEDPRMAQLAPEDVLFYCSWAGVADPKPDASATDRWMAQPGVDGFVKKLRSAILVYLNEGELEQPSVKETVGRILHSSVLEPAALYINELKFDEGKQQPEFEFALIVKLDEHQKQVTTNFDTWFQSTAQGKAGFEDYSIESIEGADNLRVIKVPVTVTNFGVDYGPCFVSLLDDIAVITNNPNEVKAIHDNLKTAAPKWLTDLRDEFPVERFASVCFINIEAIIQRIPENDRKVNWYGLRWTDLFGEAKTLGSVSGLDQHGCVSRTKLVQNRESPGLLGLVGDKPLQINEIGMVPKDTTIGFIGHFNSQGVLKIIREQIDNNRVAKEAFDDAMEQAEDFTGAKIEEEILNSFGDLVAFQYDFKLAKLFSSKVDWRLDVEIEEEMTFPGVFNQLNVGMKERIEEQFQGEITSKVHDNVKYYFFDQRNRVARRLMGWGLNDDRLVFGDGSNFELLSQKVPLEDELQLAKSKRVTLLFDEGKQRGWNGPVGILQFNLPHIFKEVETYIEMMRQDESESIDFQLSGSDFPPAKEWYEGAQPLVVGIYRVDDGFTMVHRQTYPGSAPITTLAALLLGDIARSMR
ncbi:MAG: hypothetical protein AAFN77_00815 [Planctomycetota bacterium]